MGITAKQTIKNKNLSWYVEFLMISRERHTKEGRVVLFSDRKAKYSLIGIRQGNRWWTIPVPIFADRSDLQSDDKDIEGQILSKYWWVISKQQMKVLDESIFSFARRNEYYTPFADRKGLYRFEKARKIMNPGTQSLSQQEIADVLELHPQNGWMEACFDKIWDKMKTCSDRERLFWDEDSNRILYESSSGKTVLSLDQKLVFRAFSNNKAAPLSLKLPSVYYLAGGQSYDGMERLQGRRRGRYWHK